MSLQPEGSIAISFEFLHRGFFLEREGETRFAILEKEGNIVVLWSPFVVTFCKDNAHGTFSKQSISSCQVTVVSSMPARCLKPAKHFNLLANQFKCQ
jgi:hypothetical protein